MTEFKRGEKYYIEVEVDSEHNETAVWVIHPDHPANEYVGIYVYKKHLIPQEKLEPFYYVPKNDEIHPTFLVRNRNEEHRVAAVCECWNEEDAQRICDMYNAEYRTKHSYDR